MTMFKRCKEAGLKVWEYGHHYVYGLELADKTIKSQNMDCIRAADVEAFLERHQMKPEFISSAAKLNMVHELLDENVYDDNGCVVSKKEPLITPEIARDLLGFTDRPKEPSMGGAICSDAVAEAIFRPATEQIKREIDYEIERRLGMDEFFKAEDFELPQPDFKLFTLTKQKLAEAANRLLRQKGTVVYGYDPSSLRHKTKECFCTVTGEPGGFTHQALLIDVKPIARDTAEGLLKEQLSKNHPVYCDIDWIKRAKKLLAK